MISNQSNIISSSIIIYIGIIYRVVNGFRIIKLMEFKRFMDRGDLLNTLHISLDPFPSHHKFECTMPNNI